MNNNKWKELSGVNMNTWTNIPENTTELMVVYKSTISNFTFSKTIGYIPTRNANYWCGLTYSTKYEIDMALKIENKKIMLSNVSSDISAYTVYYR